MNLEQVYLENLIEIADILKVDQVQSEILDEIKRLQEIEDNILMCRGV